MQVENANQKEKRNARSDFKIGNLALEDKQKLVGVFAWLIQEDKKQNPKLYQSTKCPLTLHLTSKV